MFFDLAFSLKCAGMTFHEIERRFMPRLTMPEAHRSGWPKYRAL